MAVTGTPILEFHISRKARDRYQFDESLFSTNGNVVFTNFHAVRSFAHKMNQQRDLINFPERAVRAGEINAMGLIDEILHMAFYSYREQRKPNVMQEALDWLYGMLGQAEVDKVLVQFVEEFPPVVVYQRKQEVQEYLEGSTEDRPNLQVALEELLMLWLANMNPAFTPYQELFDDSELSRNTAYTRIFPLLHAFFDTQPAAGPEDQNLIDLLRAPALAVPHSLLGQLEFMRQRWSTFLGKYLYRLLSSLDLIKEEQKASFTGPGPAHVLEFAGLEIEPERFSEDKDWMPRIILIAKNAYVWLDQLSKKYQRPIEHLDQVPNEELDLLRRWGITGLWLIGLWERSKASETIKKLRGNPDAVASAYSLYDYQVAYDLGGDEAYQKLHDQAWKRGIRLASDMVPNHMGIDSRWVIEHPEWFISLDYSPFPTYSFNGPNLSGDQRVGIFIEDHYYDNSDAAVVFKRVDFWTGSTKYTYHGNDGTAIPWNDTAQLNYLIPEVREAVIQTILHVARKFPVIRFDAAMTLAKKHIARLWFPEPGSGGAIPSRSEYGLTKEQFDAAMPVEFWREVVDRVAQEVPDTLLLAEAFWLMEGYFVRTLGMHRVYNSAFMNMMRDEKNAEYRLVIKNTLEFDPEILKRYVNFMNNPDERTAVDQFGKDDKYFGVCIMMVTMPGLPMIGHGQIEGFTEKYGMEYHRAYWDEQPDTYLIERHQREVFPLLRRRDLFAEVSSFLLYDFYNGDGSVNEDVFAYSNRKGDERSLVIYHNKFASARGWIRNSAAFSVKTETGDRTLVQKRLGEGLSLEDDENTWTILRDHISGLEYLRNNRELHEKGLYVELDAYKVQVYTQIRQVHDNEWHQYAHLSGYLNGRGVPSIDEALKEIFLQPIHEPFRELVSAGFFRQLIDSRLASESEKPLEEQTARLSSLAEEFEDKYTRLLSEIRNMTETQADLDSLTSAVRQKLQATLSLPVFTDQAVTLDGRKIEAAVKYLNAAGASPWAAGDERAWGTLLAWLLTHELGRVVSEDDSREISRSWIDEWLLNKIIIGALIDLGLDELTARRAVAICKQLIAYHDWWKTVKARASGVDLRLEANQLLTRLLEDLESQTYLGINRYQDILWFNKEAYDDLLWWLFAAAVVDLTGQETGTELSKTLIQKIVACHEVIKLLQDAERTSAYQVENLLEALKG
jgi:glycosidase